MPLFIILSLLIGQRSRLLRLLGWTKVQILCQLIDSWSILYCLGLVRHPRQATHLSQHHFVIINHMWLVMVAKKVDKHKLSFALTARNLYFLIENWRSLGKIWKPAESLLRPRSFDLVDVKKSILWPSLLWPSSFNPHAEAVNRRTVSNFIPWFFF
jgi:hypothetical protein